VGIGGFILKICPNRMFFCFITVIFLEKIRVK